MYPGHIIFLNGCSSAGKTSLARELQRVLDQPYLYVGIDTFCGMKAARYWGVDAFLYIPDDPFYETAPEIEMSATDFKTLQYRVFPELVSGYHRSIAALATAGNNVIVDHVLQVPGWREECVALLAPYEVYFIGVQCSLAALENRELARGDRPIGMARFHFTRVHSHGIYDFEVNTEQDAVEVCAQQIKDFLQSNPTPIAFSQLRKLQKEKKQVQTGSLDVNIFLDESRT